MSLQSEIEERLRLKVEALDGKILDGSPRLREISHMILPSSATEFEVAMQNMDPQRLILNPIFSIPHTHGKLTGITD